MILSHFRCRMEDLQLIKVRGTWMRRQETKLHSMYNFESFFWIERTWKIYFTILARVEVRESSREIQEPISKIKIIPSRIYK